MPNKLHFSLVSPERELVSKQVSSVDIPGVEGWMGILPNHAPLMTVMAPGVVILKDDGAEEKIFVRGGFAEVAPGGLTVLAEEATPVAELDRSAIEQRIANAREDVTDAGDNAEKSLAARQNLERLEELLSAL
ncbi:MAG: F0F1 ATP synthase subunit epsilon [Pseudomonadota bacterium]